MYKTGAKVRINERKSKYLLDFSELEYLSSAGLRVLLVAQRIMGKKGHMPVRNVNESVMEILTITGFNNVLDIEA